jgi:hypothetical protein
VSLPGLPRWLSAVALFGLGAASGLASVAVHDKSWPWFLLAVAAPLATTVALASGLLRSAFVAGWFGLLMLATLGRPEGDYAIASSGRGYGLLAAGLLLLGFAVATIRRPVRTSP